MAFSKERDRERFIFKTACKCANLSGDLTVTNRGVYFNKKTGFMGSGRTRIHSYDMEEIQDLRIEAEGSLRGNVLLAIDHRTPDILGKKTKRYSMGRANAERVIFSVKQMRITATAPSQLGSLVLRLVKPEGEAELKEIASQNDVRTLIAQIRRVQVAQLNDTDAFRIVRETVGGLIADGKLDGIISGDDKYISSALVTRKTVQYQVVIDFTSLLKQLESKGIVLQSLDCPSCKSKLEYPKDGSRLSCQYCGATIEAMDIFEKFKGLLS